MANVSRVSGFSPVQYLNGSPWNGQGRVYCIPDTDDTNAYAIGDPVKSAGDADAAGIPTVTLGTAGAAARGVIVSAGGRKFGTGYYDFSNLNTTVIPATKTYSYYVLVVDDPNVIFEIEEDGVGGTIAAASVGLNANFVAGTNNGYVSGFMLDSSSVNTTATLNCKILCAAPRQDNALGTACKWWVTLNSHEFKAGTTGV